MIVLVGESASGKSTIERELVKFGYRKLVTYTARQPRDGERDGVAYHFISEEKFNEMKRRVNLPSLLCIMAGSMALQKRIVLTIKLLF